MTFQLLFQFKDDKIAFSGIARKTLNKILCKHLILTTIQIKLFINLRLKKPIKIGEIHLLKFN